MDPMHNKVDISYNSEIWKVALRMENESMDQILGQSEAKDSQQKERNRFENIKASPTHCL